MGTFMYGISGLARYGAAVSGNRIIDRISATVSAVSSYNDSCQFDYHYKCLCYTVLITHIKIDSYTDLFGDKFKYILTTAYVSEKKLKRSTRKKTTCETKTDEIHPNS